MGTDMAGFSNSNPSNEPSEEKQSVFYSFFFLQHLVKKKKSYFLMFALHLASIPEGSTLRKDFYWSVSEVESCAAHSWSRTEL